MSAATKCRMRRITRSPSPPNTPLSENWIGTFHSDFYWQSQSWARIWNDRNYDKIHGYSNVNLAIILNDATGWQVMAYVKNIFDTTAITGDFLYSDDTGLTTNIFLTDPRLYGIRITKHFGEGDWDNGGSLDFIPDFFADADGGKPTIWLQAGGNFSLLAAAQDPYRPDETDWIDINGGNPLFWPNKQNFITPENGQKWPTAGFDWEGAITFRPGGSDWKLKMGVRYGRSSRDNTRHKSQPKQTPQYFSGVACSYIAAFLPSKAFYCSFAPHGSFTDVLGGSSEQHMMLDFTLGKDVGIGLSGTEGTGTLAAGVRFAQFNSNNSFDINVMPYYHVAPKYGHLFHDLYDGKTVEHRSFRGMGPEITWDSSNIVWGDVTNGAVNVDWGVNLAMLFGEQKVSIERSNIYHCHSNSTSNVPTPCPESNTTDTFTTKADYTIERSRRATVPNIGAHIGLSYNYRNAKLSFGYKADAFFNAIDGGQEQPHEFDRIFYGPYMNVSIGLGG